MENTKVCPRCKGFGQLVSIGNPHRIECPDCNGGSGRVPDPDPQAAPPETDLRELSDEQVIQEYERALLYKPNMTGWSVARLQEHIGKTDQWRNEILRRLARPEALREQVMAAIDGATAQWGEDVYGVGEFNHENLCGCVKAAVAAVLEDA